MPILENGEPLITLQRVSLECADMLPRRRQGKLPHLSFWFRMAQSGGLETVNFGGTKCTSRAAVARWIAARSGKPAPTPAKVTRERKARTDRVLDAAGI